VSPEVWALVTRELITIRQLTRNWLDPPKAEKIERHVEVLRQLIREATSGLQDSRRALLWWRSPECFWCGRVVSLGRSSGCADAATLDHLQRRGERGGERKRNTRRRLPLTVLACYQCNHARGEPPARPNPMCPVLRVRVA
jgi:hypothetical protein